MVTHNNITIVKIVTVVIPMQCGSLLNFIVKFLTRFCLIHFGLKDFTIRFHKLPLLNDNDKWMRSAKKKPLSSNRMFGSYF